MLICGYHGTHKTISLRKTWLRKTSNWSTKRGSISHSEESENPLARNSQLLKEGRAADIQPIVPWPAVSPMSKTDESHDIASTFCQQVNACEQIKPLDPSQPQVFFDKNNRQIRNAMVVHCSIFPFRPAEVLWTEYLRMSLKARCVWSSCHLAHFASVGSVIVSVFQTQVDVWGWEKQRLWRHGFGQNRFGLGKGTR